MIDLGRLDFQAVLYTPTTTQGLGAVQQTVWTKAGTFWLSQVTASLKTVLTGARDADQIESVFMSRWFDGLAVGMRFTVEGHAYRIVKLDELGRRDGWRIYGRAVE